jgi:hypothetical protein
MGVTVVPLFACVGAGVGDITCRQVQQRMRHCKLLLKPLTRVVAHASSIRTVHMHLMSSACYWHVLKPFASTIALYLSLLV